MLPRPPKAETRVQKTERRTPKTGPRVQKTEWRHKIPERPLITKLPFCSSRIMSLTFYNAPSLHTVKFFLAKSSVSRGRRHLETRVDSAKTWCISVTIRPKTRWTFRIFFIFFDSGESEVPGGEGGTAFNWKSPEGGGLLGRWGGGSSGRGKKLHCKQEASNCKQKSRIQFITCLTLTIRTSWITPHHFIYRSLIIVIISPPITPNIFRGFK